MTEWEIYDRYGKRAATHVRYARPDGSKAMYWIGHDTMEGLGGVPVSALPLYGSERLTDDHHAVVLAEGEKAADAINRALAGMPNLYALGTVTGAAGTPGADALSVLAGRIVILWPDADDVGAGHMSRIAVALEGVALSVRMVIWHRIDRGADAADLTREAIRHKIIHSVRWRLDNR